MRSTNNNIIAAADASIGQVSVAIDCMQKFSMSVQVVTTGTSTGTLKLQASNDPVAKDQNGVFTVAAWSDITGATVSVAAAGAVLIPKLDCSYRYVRAVWTATNAAAGTVTASFFALGY